jgi:hypothetical protein
MRAQQSPQGNRNDREEGDSEVSSETELADADKEVRPAMEAIRIMTENLRTYLLSRK